MKHSNKTSIIPEDISLVAGTLLLNVYFFTVDKSQLMFSIVFAFLIVIFFIAEILVIKEQKHRDLKQLSDKELKIFKTLEDLPIIIILGLGFLNKIFHSALIFLIATISFTIVTGLFIVYQIVLSNRNKL